MPSHHQRYSQVRFGDGHGCHSAMDPDHPSYQVKFLLTVIKTTSRTWVLGHTKPGTAWENDPSRPAVPRFGMASVEVPVELPAVQPTPGRPFGLYVHVPFCITRCGYCDFNTYTPAELGGVNPDAWLEALRTELERAAARLGGPTVDTVFVGGGTPSLLGGARLTRLLDMVRDHFTLAPDAEITTEANPESTWPEFFEEIREAGYTRVSLGMQTVVPRLLGVLDRVHTPNRSAAAAREALALGFEHVSLDLIYGTPGRVR